MRKKHSTVQNSHIADALDMEGAGHAQTRTLTGDLTLVDTDAVVQYITPDAARNITLPAESIANHPFQIYNAGAFVLTVKNDAATTIMTVGGLETGRLTSNGVAWTGVSLGGGFKTGDVKMHAGATLETGWLYCDGKTLGDSTSGADYAGDTYRALYDELNAKYGGTHNWAAHNTVTLPDLRGRVPVGVGTNADVNDLGKSDAVAVASRTPNHAHGPGSHTHSTPNHQHQVLSNAQSNLTGSAILNIAYANGSNHVADTDNSGAGTSGTPSASNTGAGAPPYLTFYFIIKL